jgi:flagella basal body P-ring formation protein FlgA
MMKNLNKETVSKSGLLKKLVWSLSCIIYLAVYVSARDVMEIYPNTTVKGADVLLKDIVRNLSSLPSGWGERTLMPAPKPGVSSEYTLTSIAYMLQKYPDMHEILLHGKNTLVITRKGCNISEQKIEEAITDFVRNHENWDQIKTRIESEPVRKMFHLPEGDVAVKVKSYEAQHAAERYKFTLIAEINGEKQKEFTTFAKIIPQQKIWVSKQVLRKDHCITAGDLKTAYVDAKSSKSYIPVNESIEGLQLIRTIRENEPINDRFIVKPMCVRRGDTLHVTAKSGPLMVSLRAKALDSGREGDYILCLNERSKRRVRVKLTGQQQAIVDF